jgi:hypothetical protein
VLSQLWRTNWIAVIVVGVFCCVSLSVDVKRWEAERLWRNFFRTPDDALAFVVCPLAAWVWSTGGLIVLLLMSTGVWVNETKRR